MDFVCRDFEKRKKKHRPSVKIVNIHHEHIIILYSPRTFPDPL